MRRWNLVFLIAGLAGLTFMLVKLDFGSLVGGVADVGVGLGIAVALHFVGMVCDAGCMLLCSSHAVGANLWHTLRAYLAGHAINMVTPGGNIGEITKYTIIAERLPREEVAAAVFLQNIFATLANLVYFAVVAALVPLLVPIERGLATVLHVSAAVCVGICLAVWPLFRLHLPRWPFRVARRLGLSEARAEAARGFLHRVGVEMGRFKRDRLRAALAITLTISSRLTGAAEVWVLVSFLAPSVSPAVPLLLSGWNQILAWAFAFVPMSIGTAEGGAYLLFRLMGVTPALGVILELTRKALRLLYVAIGMGLLGWQALRR